MNEDLVELGFEGLDRLTDKYHDKVYGVAGSKRQSWLGGKKHASKDAQARPHKQEHQTQHQEQQKPQDQLEPLQKSMSHDDSSRMMYGPERGQERDWSGGDRGGDYARNPRAEDRGYRDVPAADSLILAHGRNEQDYYGGYQVAPPAPSPRYGYDARPPGPAYDDRWESDRNRPVPMRRRNSSYSPPRRNDRRRHSSPRRARSKSGDRNRVTATVVGALAGGLIGNAAKSNSTWTTIAGAVVGGVGAREAEKLYDRRKEREIEEDERRLRRRRDRESEREQWRG